MAGGFPMSGIRISDGTKFDLAGDGTDGTGITQPTGGAGIRGWLSGIYSKLSGILSVQPAYVAPAVWATPTTAWDGRAYAAVTISVAAAPTGAYTLQWSPDGTTWFAVTGLDLSFAQQTGISTSFTGAITTKGGGYVRLSGGTAGTFLIGGGQ